MSCISLAGWLSGVFNAVKLLYSFSTSGPSSILKPISEKAQAAIIKVANAQGFDYVLDSTQGQGVILANGKDLMGDVKSELGF